jgi:hypothetical protein
MATILTHLADPRSATPGPCAICGSDATSWRRTGLAAGGLVRAARACEAHEHDVVSALAALTMDDCVSFVPRARRLARADAAERRAERLCARAGGWRRMSASLRGASSHTHTCALVGGACAREAAALDAYAAALRASIGTGGES